MDNAPNAAIFTNAKRSTSKRWKLPDLAVAMIAVAAGVMLSTGWRVLGQDPPTEPPAMPTGLTSSPTYNSVVLSWDDPDDDNITGYQILRRDTTIHEQDEFAVLADDTGSSGNSYTDNIVASDTRYVYRIKARNTAGLSSESTFVNVTTLVSSSVDRDSIRDRAIDLGDITTTLTPGFASGSVADSSDAIDYYRFTLTEPMRVGLGPRQQDANADLFLGSADGDVLQESRETGKTNEAISRGLAAGTYYIRVHAQESRRNDYKLRYGVSAVDLENEADDSWDTPKIQDLPGWEVAGDRMLIDDGSRLSDQQLASVTHTLNSLETHNINHAGDVDWFKLNLDEDSLYVIKIKGRGVDKMTGLTLENPAIFAVYNSDAQHYPYTYDMGGSGDHHSMLLFHSQHTGDSQVYYLAVTGTGEETGTYSIMAVKMEDAQNWTFGHELGTRGSITVDAAPQEAEIAFEGDIDFWEFQGTAGQEYHFSIRPIGTYRDNCISPVLRGLYYDDPRY